MLKSLGEGFRGMDLQGLLKRTMLMGPGGTKYLIQDNLKQWLTPLRKAGGAICNYANMSKQLLWLSQAVDKKLKEQDATASFVWKHNALRHSFISYRVAQTQNVAQVALEAGNSAGMIFKHYNELVQPDSAKAWFAIVPAGKN